MSLNDRISALCLNEYMADVHFEFNDSDELIPAHKFVLSVGSCVFEAMFQRNPDNSGIIHVPDMESQAFRILLRFLYGDSNNPSLAITHDTVMSILYGAKKYCVLGLERLCVDFLKKNISIENALILLSQARLFDEAQLAAQCLEVIDKNAMYALQTPELLDLDLETLMAILKRDTLGVREIKLWQTSIAWAKNKCKNLHQNVTPELIRQMLGGALKLIRFPLMSQEEFAQGPAQSGILTDKEVISIFLYFNLPAKSYKLCEFDDEPRSTFKEYIINRFREGEVEHRWSYSDAFDRIRFKCDRRLFIAGYGLYGSIREPFEYNVHIQVKEKKTSSFIDLRMSLVTSSGFRENHWRK